VGVSWTDGSDTFRNSYRRVKAGQTDSVSEIDVGTFPGAFPRISGTDGVTPIKNPR
jgi:hypothetical protein